MSLHIFVVDSLGKRREGLIDTFWYSRRQGFDQVLAQNPRIFDLIRNKSIFDLSFEEMYTSEWTPKVTSLIICTVICSFDVDAVYLECQTVTDWPQWLLAGNARCDFRGRLSMGRCLRR